MPEIEATGQEHSADEGMTHHGGADPRGLDAVPQSPLFEGRFGRMFRELPAARCRSRTLIALGKAMSETERAGESADNPRIPAAYTYLGQFIDHDITFDPVSELTRRNDPDALRTFRTPRYDLDSLYGSGPADQPFLYRAAGERFRGVKLLEGLNPDTDRDGNPLDRRDLLRNREERAIIGDPRNDENIIVSQLHLAFVRLHNRTVNLVAERSPSLSGAALFEEARRLATWHYQWVVVKDFLPRIVGDETAAAVWPGGGAPDLRFFTWRHDPYMPVEFSGAAYRFGHSLVRPEYDLNEVVTQVPIFARSARPGPLEHLGGFRALPAAWTIDWSRFISLDGSTPQLARKIDARLARPLLRLPRGIDAARNALSTLNLRRGRALRLPSGQAVARAMGLEPLDAAELRLDRWGLPSDQRAELERDAPLWYYTLREAERGGGEHLGPVAGRIVAEVLVGLLEGDPQSFLNQQPAWRPEGLPARRRGEFTLADLLAFAGPRRGGRFARDEDDEEEEPLSTLDAGEGA